MKGLLRKTESASAGVVATWWSSTYDTGRVPFRSGPNHANTGELFALPPNTPFWRTGTFMVVVPYVTYAMPRQGQTGLTLKDETFDQLAADKPDGVTWDRYLLKLKETSDYE